MRTVNDICKCIDDFVHFDLQPPEDNSGLLIGDPNADAEKVLFCLDATRGALEAAHNLGAGLVVSHHPVIFDPLKAIPAGSAVEYAVKNSIAVISAHIPADEAENGANYLLAKKLGLTSIKPFCPVSVNTVLRCQGYCGLLDEPMHSRAFAGIVGDRLGCPVRYGEGRKITSVAVCGGAGGFLIKDVIDQGIDCLVTGEVKYHQFLAAAAAETTVIDAGHYATEIHIAALLKDIVAGKYGHDGLYLYDGPSPIKFI